MCPSLEQDRNRAGSSPRAAYLSCPRTARHGPQVVGSRTERLLVVCAECTTTCTMNRATNHTHQTLTFIHYLEEPLFYPLFYPISSPQQSSREAYPPCVLLHIRTKTRALSDMYRAKRTKSESVQSDRDHPARWERTTSLAIIEWPPGASTWYLC